jgi:hypothetical protein
VKLHDQDPWRRQIECLLLRCNAGCDVYGQAAVNSPVLLLYCCSGSITKIRYRVTFCPASATHMPGFSVTTRWSPSGIFSILEPKPSVFCCHGMGWDGGSTATAVQSSGSFGNRMLTEETAGLLVSGKFLLVSRLWQKEKRVRTC